MPVSIVVGGQFGSEGKGKVALHIARKTGAKAVVRVGGPNSGHTGIDDDGERRVLRQLPASALFPGTIVVLPAGSMIDPGILRAEVELIGLDHSRLVIDRRATVVTEQHRIAENGLGLIDTIGSTGSGTGAALAERILRSSSHQLAQDDNYLRKFSHPDTAELLRELLNDRQRVVIEGTQGFGLSVWHGDDYPFATSRDTSAASFASEAGVAPHDVDDVILTLRTFPIRVGGNSGPLPNEVDWKTLSAEANLPSNYKEFTSATNRVRRVARFDPQVVKRAITINNPTRIVMNHMDYVGTALDDEKVTTFISSAESSIGRRIDLIGFAPDSLVSRTGTD